jgi:hypothetical protein
MKEGTTENKDLHRDHGSTELRIKDEKKKNARQCSILKNMSEITFL